jgi:hypothetical protein
MAVKRFQSGFPKKHIKGEQLRAETEQEAKALKPERNVLSFWV